MDCKKQPVVLLSLVTIAGLFSCSTDPLQTEIDREIKQVKDDFEEQERLSHEIDSIHERAQRLLDELKQNDSLHGSSYTFDPNKK